MARRCSTIGLPVGKDAYTALVGDPGRFRAWLDQAYRDHPELFPTGFNAGYRLKDARTSARTGARLRRIRLKATGESFSIRPSFLLPYLVGTTDDAHGPLFLRAFGGPFWALARVFGHDPMYWYRVEVGRGRNSTAGTTVRRTDLPDHLLADEHHQTRDGQKNYIATTVGAGCCPGAARAPTANADDLTTAYGVFKHEAEDVRKDYPPKTVSVDGWASTHQAWRAVFRMVVRVRCFLRGWLNIRNRGKLSGSFRELSDKVGDAYRAPDRRRFAERLRRVGEWARRQSLSAWVLEPVEKLWGRSKEYAVAYAHPGGHRASNMPDRVMRGMNRYFEGGQHLRGTPRACGRHVRAWALLHNFRPWNPAVARGNDGWRSPAERLNKHRYHDDWLPNLLASGSLGGYRR